MAAPPSAPDAQLAAALLSSFMPQVASLSSKLVELQEQQQIMVAAVGIYREELANGTEEWKQAKAVLERIPGLLCSLPKVPNRPHPSVLCAEYQAKLARLHRTMAAGHAQLLKANKAAVALRVRLEERDAETRARRAAEQAAYQSVSASSAGDESPH